MTKFTTGRSLLNALAKAMNLIDPTIENHHQETAYLAYQIGVEMGLDTESLHMIVVSALLHDVGTTVMPVKDNLAAYEEHRREIARIGADMIRDLEPFDRFAGIIELCRNSYQENKRFSEACMERIEVAETIHLADIVSALWDEDADILNQVSRIREAVEQGRGTEFSDIYSPQRPVQTADRQILQDADKRTEGYVDKVKQAHIEPAFAFDYSWRSSAGDGSWMTT